MPTSNTRHRKPRRKWGPHHKYLSHAYQYSVDGEDLPESPTTDKLFVPRLKMTALLALPIWFLLASIVNLLFALYKGARTFGPANAHSAAVSASISSVSASRAAAAQASAETLSSTSMKLPDFSNMPVFKTGHESLQYAFSHWLPIVFSNGHVHFNGNVFTTLGTLAIALVLAWMIAQRFNYASRSVAHDQLGDARFLEIEEIKERYPEIPEKRKPFKGYGGMAVSHFKNSYYINDQTVNTLVIGTSRSGKGQMTIIESIDNLSRASEQSSMVVNDPKGELFVASKDTLERRGYDVHVLNLADPLQSMSYNPLSLITQAWVRGDIETATQMINTLTHSLYSSDDAGENKWVYEGAQSAVNGMIMTLLKYCVDHNCTEKVTLYNVSDMLNELGTLNYMNDPEHDIAETNALDAWFQSLSAGDPAKKQYGSTSFSGERAKGSILSTVNQGLAPFELAKNAKMTSLNSLEMKSIGFPKFVTFQFPANMFNELISIQFFRDRKNIATYKVRIGANGFTEYNFDAGLKEDDIMIVRRIQGQDKKAFASYKLHFVPLHDDNGEVILQKKLGHENEPEIDKHVELKQLRNRMNVLAASLFYTEKPVALFMLIPDSDTSNHALASIFISQLYKELAKQASNSPGQKCTRRVHFILDEFGNMIKIPDMAQILTVTNGRNMLWDLVVQSFKQLQSKYGDADSATIKGNCQLWIYIFSIDQDTVQEISDRLGNATQLSETNSKSTFNINEGIQQNAEADAILTKERINGLLEGESIVMDPLHRLDNQRRKVRSFPIFNTKTTVMPYAYQFLKDEFDPSGNINEIQIDSRHANLDLEKNAIDYRPFLVDAAGRDAYNDRSEADRAKTLDKAPEAQQKPVLRVRTPQVQLESLGLSRPQAEAVLSRENYANARVGLIQMLKENEIEDNEVVRKGEIVLNRYFEKKERDSVADAS